MKEDSGDRILITRRAVIEIQTKVKDTPEAQWNWTGIEGSATLEEAQRKASNLAAAGYEVRYVESETRLSVVVLK